MDELIKKLLAIFPKYADQLLRLITGPKRFIAERVSKNELEVGDALVFLGVSILLASILSLMFYKGDPIVMLGVSIVINATSYIALGLCVCWAWRSVGGKADLRQMLSITFYYAGVLSYIVILTTLSTFGIVKEASTSLYESYYNVFYGGCSALSVFESIQSRKDVIAKELLTNLGLYGTLSLPTILTGLEVVPHSLWLFVGWGAYRKLNASSRFRSCLAFALCILFLAPIWSLLALAGLQVFRAFAPEVSC